MAATAASAFCTFIVGLTVLPALGFLPHRVPLSVLVMTVFLMAFGTALPRLLLRISGWKAYNRTKGHGKRVLIAGAGIAGKLILRELLANQRLSLEPVGFLDDDVRLHGQLLTGLPVLGPLAKAGALAQKHQATEIIIAMPSAPGKVIRQIVAAAREANVDTRIMPELSELLTRSTGRVQLRHVEIQDLLRREPVSVNISQVQLVVSGVTVLVTGAGGSTVKTRSSRSSMSCGARSRRFLSSPSSRTFATRRGYAKSSIRIVRASSFMPRPTSMCR